MESSFSRRNLPQRALPCARSDAFRRAATQIGSRSLLFAGCYRKRVPLHTAQRFSPILIMSPVCSRKPAAWQNCGLRTVLLSKMCPANHPAHELTVPSSLEYTFLYRADDDWSPPKSGARSASSTGASSTTRLFISPESLVLCLHLLVKPCQFFRLGFTCEPERHLD
jgi:hypothetical protein